jgi:hypothetical protein
VPANDLIPYLLELVVEWLVGRPELTRRHLAGTVVYVDISGFTRLSEGLASVAAATTRRAAFELALTLRTLDRLGVAADTDSRRDSSEIFHRLGVTAVLDWHPTRGGALSPV